MSIEQYDAAVLVSGLEAPAKPVLTALAWHHNGDTGRCFPSYETLADDTGYSVRTVIRAVKRLAALGLITVTERKVKRPNGSKVNTSNEYTFHLGVSQSGTGASPRVTDSHHPRVRASPDREGIGNILQGDFSSRGRGRRVGNTRGEVVSFPGGHAEEDIPW